MLALCTLTLILCASLAYQAVYRDRRRRRFRPLLVGLAASLAVALLVCGSAFAGPPDPCLEFAQARANACIAIAKATDAKPCVSQECVLASARATSAIDAVKEKAATTKAITDPCTGKRYTWREGFGGYVLEGQDPPIFRVPPRGVPSRLPAGDGCYLDPNTGQTVCPYRR